jgi:hypothetical protein
MSDDGERDRKKFFSRIECQLPNFGRVREYAIIMICTTAVLFFSFERTIPPPFELYCNHLMKL